MTATSVPLLKTPRRFLFIASIGNPRPYRSTRHSAGHLLLDALIPHLLPRIPLVSSAATGRKTSDNAALFYKTWHSPSLMNVSGKKLVRDLQQWIITTQTEILEKAVQQGQVALSPTIADTSASEQPERTSWQRRGVDPRSLTVFEPTLVILHDELEAPLGKVRVKRGGPEAASLRGHRGLISIMEQLQAKRMYPPRTRPVQGYRGGLSVLRIGVGIGRPVSREKGSVADYVLAEMNSKELAAVRAAVGPVLDALDDELYRENEQVKPR